MVIAPPHFPRPRGYSNGVLASGAILHVAGQIGWELDGSFATDDFVAQLDKALGYVLDVVREAGGCAEHVVSMTIYVTELDAYRSRLPEIKSVWLSHMGRNYPAMALVGVAGLVELRAKVEVQAVAVLPDRVL